MFNAYLRCALIGVPMCMVQRALHVIGHVCVFVYVEWWLAWLADWLAEQHYRDRALAK